MNSKANERLQQAFKLWFNTAKSLTYLNRVKLEQKKAPLIIIEALLTKNQKEETKKCIGMFNKNTKIIMLQTNFLRKLCDTQAGKTQKALMIWKNLPKPKNK